MQSEIFVALLSFCGTLLGVFGGLQLVNYRLKMLEKKVDKHNNVIERMFIMEERQNVANDRIKYLEESVKEVKENV